MAGSARSDGCAIFDTSADSLPGIVPPADCDGLLGGEADVVAPSVPFPVDPCLPFSGDPCMSPAGIQFVGAVFVSNSSPCGLIPKDIMVLLSEATKELLLIGISSQKALIWSSR